MYKSCLSLSGKYYIECQHTSHKALTLLTWIPSAALHLTLEVRHYKVKACNPKRNWKFCFDFILCWDKEWKGGIDSFNVNLWASFVVLSSWGGREEGWGGAGDRYIRLVFPLTYTKLKSGRKKVIYSKLSQFISDETSLRWINFFR